MSLPPSVILASASASRRAILTQAGVPCEAKASRVDESTVKESLRAEGASAADVAEVLAELKAMQISRRHPGALVIGADQMLECQGEWFDKAPTPQAARETLCALRGKAHHCDKARLTMRPFSDDFLDQYLAALGERACETVGVYHLEGLGAQLFSQISGDFFTILGLPLVPLMGFLRAHGVLVE
jgi:septum formation protein